MGLLTLREEGKSVTIKMETEWGVVYPYAPTVVHPMVDRASAEAHVRSTGSILMWRGWLRDAPEVPLHAYPDHKPVQHRDGKPPWCKTCGLTAQYTVPVSRFAPTGDYEQQERERTHRYFAWVREHSPHTEHFMPTPGGGMICDGCGEPFGVPTSGVELPLCAGWTLGLRREAGHIYLDWHRTGSQDPHLPHLSPDEAVDLANILLALAPDGESA